MLVRELERRSRFDEESLVLCHVRRWVVSLDPFFRYEVTFRLDFPTFPLFFLFHFLLFASSYAWKYGIFLTKMFMFRLRSYYSYRFLFVLVTFRHLEVLMGSDRPHPRLPIHTVRSWCLLLRIRSVCCWFLWFPTIIWLPAFRYLEVNSFFYALTWSPSSLYNNWELVKIWTS